MIEHYYSIPPCLSFALPFELGGTIGLVILQRLEQQSLSNDKIIYIFFIESSCNELRNFNTFAVMMYPWSMKLYQDMVVQ